MRKLMLIMLTAFTLSVNAQRDTTKVDTAFQRLAIEKYEKMGKMIENTFTKAQYDLFMNSLAVIFNEMIVEWSKRKK